jgi:hypothetical protein
VRGYFLTSGPDGRWTAPAFSLGGSHALFGDGQTSFGVHPVPGAGGNSDAALGTTQTTNLFGVVPALRLEMPTKSIYVAFDLELAVMTSFSSDAPGTAFEGRFAIVLGLRHRRGASAPAIEEPVQRRFTRPGVQ